MKILKEFKEFSVKGNMLDMAIGIMVGSAFKNIVNSLVKDILMPPMGYIIGKVDLNDFKWIMQAEVKSEEGQVIVQQVSLNYGQFIQGTFDFLIIAFIAFFIVKLINNMKRKAEDNTNVEVPTPKDIELLSEIRDLLKEKK